MLWKKYAKLYVLADNPLISLKEREKFKSPPRIKFSNDRNPSYKILFQNLGTIAVEEMDWFVPSYPFCFHPNTTIVRKGLAFKNLGFQVVISPPQLPYAIGQAKLPTFKKRCKIRVGFILINHGFLHKYDFWENNLY